VNRCSVADCELPALARGWCRKHYARWQRYGDPATVKLRKDLTPYERVMAHVVPDGECAVFTGYRDRRGDATISANGRNLSGHRVVWEHHHGPLSPGQVVAHLCNNRPCVRIEHLSTDPLARSFGRMKYSPQVVAEAIRRVDAGERASIVARDLGVSRGQVSKWARGLHLRGRVPPPRQH